MGSLSAASIHQVKPRLLLCASPVIGHTTPMLRLADEFVRRGYVVSMIAGEEFHESIEKIGATAFSVQAMLTPELFARRSQIPPGPEQLVFDAKEVFIKPTQHRMESLYKALEDLHEEDPAGEIVVVTESWFLGTQPMYLGAPLPKGFVKRPRIVNIHASLYVASSIDVPPFGMALPPDATDEGRAKNKAFHDGFAAGPGGQLTSYQGEIFRSLGATGYKEDVVWNSLMLDYDVTLHMCHPDLEYPRSDQSSKIKFVGSVEPRPLKNFAFPSFWNEVIGGAKRVVVVTQGTVAIDYKQLIIPTLTALANRTDLIVVAILGSKGATLPSEVAVPSNARIIDYLSYDAILPHASVFVLNAGYGGFIHGVVNGVPMVLSGASEDKPDVAARGEWAGVGVNLKTGSPSVEQVGGAVSTILADPGYKKRVARIQRENSEMNAMDAVEAAISMDNGWIN